MIHYISNTGGGAPVNFEQAILDGFAIDGGLYVPTELPQISLATLTSWQGLSYQELALEVLSLFIDETTIPRTDLREIIQTAYAPFELKSVIPLKPLKSVPNTFMLELFHGPTLSFKDVGQAFLINVVNYFLKRKEQHLSVIVATTGDTGPAAAYFAAGKSNMDAWVLYPSGMITPEQERQMTTLPHPNIHPVAVAGCPDGGDDLDLVIANLYANIPFKEQLQLSSVNSINWGRILMQSVHYFYGYLLAIDKVGEPIHMSVPSGGFGNLCAGGLARKMGLPIKCFVIANNRNDSLNRIFTKGLFLKAPLYETPASAIDILIPYNFWRYLYFCEGVQSEQIKHWKTTFDTTGQLQFEEATFESYRRGFLSYQVSNEETLSTIKSVYEAEQYLLDPHGAVAIQAAQQLSDQLGTEKMVCLATAHPAKFSKVIKEALQVTQLPSEATHPSIEKAKSKGEKKHSCHHDYLESALMEMMEVNWAFTKGKKEIS